MCLLEVSTFQTHFNPSQPQIFCRIYSLCSLQQKIGCLKKFLAWLLTRLFQHIQLPFPIIIFYQKHLISYKNKKNLLTSTPIFLCYGLLTILIYTPIVNTNNQLFVVLYLSLFFLKFGL